MNIAISLIYYHDSSQLLILLHIIHINDIRIKLTSLFIVILCVLVSVCIVLCVTIHCIQASTPIRTTQLVAATPVVSVTSLSPAQLQAAAQRSMAGRSVTPSQQLQFQALKHSTLIRQQGTTTAVRTAGEAGAGQMKRIQQVVTSQAIKVTSQVAPGQLVTHTTQAGVAKVGPLGQVVGQVGQTVKTATGARTVVNERELTQLLKRNQAGQQKILATGATLVKPSGVPLPVSAVTVTGGCSI